MGKAHPDSISFLSVEICPSMKSTRDPIFLLTFFLLTIRGGGSSFLFRDRIERGQVAQVRPGW